MSRRLKKSKILSIYSDCYVPTKLLIYSNIVVHHPSLIDEWGSDCSHIYETSKSIENRFVNHESQVTKTNGTSTIFSKFILFFSVRIMSHFPRLFQFYFSLILLQIRKGFTGISQ